MSLFNSLGRFFGSQATHEAAQIGAGVLGCFNPGLGSLVEMIGNAVYSVEQSAPAGTSGPAKKTQAQSLVDVSTPVALAVLQSVTGKTVADPSALAPAISALIDDMVALFHALGVFPATAAVATAPKTETGPAL